jgi:hypothetical protein
MCAFAKEIIEIVGSAVMINFLMIYQSCSFLQHDAFYPPTPISIYDREMVRNVPNV